MTRRGLSLVETLAATALLALLGVAVAGFCTEAARAGSRAAPRADISVLAEQADQIVADTELVRSVRSGASPTVVRRAGLEIRVSRRAERDADHAWLVFESGSMAVIRWARVQREERDR